jgi:hypothetical protein
MTRYLHQLSSFFFYVLGLSFLAAYVLLRNEMLGYWSAVWLQAADLPFALAAILYGGLSLYLSLATGRKSSVLAWGIGIPLAALFVLLVVLNFWGVWPFTA